MPRSTTWLALAPLVLTASVPAAAQSLEKRHQIELRIGVWNQVTDSRTHVGTGGVSTTAGTSGFFGGLAYGHWLRENLAARINVGGMAANVDTEVGTSGVSTSTATVTALLAGIKYYFPRSTYGTSVRPFAGAGAGAFIGSQMETDVGSTITVEARTEPAIGGEVTAGVDFILGRRVLTTVAVGYSIMTDFAEPIGGSENYSGPQLTLGISLLLG